MRTRIKRLFYHLAVVRGEGTQVMITRRVIKAQLRAQHPDYVGMPQMHADLRANNRAIANLGRKALATILRA